MSCPLSLRNRLHRFIMNKHTIHQSSRNYNEPTDGRYCEEDDDFCYENRVCMQVLKQVFPLEDINHNPDITLNAGDWHDNPQNLIFPGKTDTCNITYIHVNNTIKPKRLTFYYASSLSFFLRSLQVLLCVSM